MATNLSPNNTTRNAQPKERKLLLAKLFTDAPVRKEEKEESKIIVAGMQEAQPTKEYPDTFFGRAMAVLRGELSTLFKSALFFILFTIPFIVILAWFAGYFEKLVLGGTYNFMGDIGVGFPGGGDDIAQSVATLLWQVKTPVIAMLAACLIIGSFGLSGIFYCCKRSYFQDYYKKPFKTFWIGFTKYWWQFLVSSFIMVIIGLGMAVALMNLLSLQALGSADAGAYCIVVFTWIIGAPLLLIPMVMMSLFTSYELTFVQCFKNALVLIANQPVVTIIVACVSAAPLIVLGVTGSMFAIIIYIAMVLIGQALFSLMWIALGDRGMVKCHNRKKLTDKQAFEEQRKAQKQAQKQVARQNGAPSQSKKKPQQVHYQNPKKKKKK